MDFPRLTRIAMELVNRRRRPRVLDYATPEPRLTWRQRAEAWRQGFEAAGDARWLLLALAGVCLIVIGVAIPGRYLGKLVSMAGVILVVVSVARWRGDDPW